MPKIKLALLAAVVSGFFLVPSLASGACTLPTSPVLNDGAVDNSHLNDYIDTGQSIVKSGKFMPNLNGKFVQIPFTAPEGASGMRVRYCYEDKGPDGQTGPGFNDDNATLDLGVYEPNAADPGNFTAAQSRGWSGSAVKMIGIGVNGFSSPTDYEVNRKAYEPGMTNRGYEPGPIQAGKWAVELGAGFIHPNDDGVEWTIEVTFSNHPAWNYQPFQPDPYTPNVANPNAGWYSGDLHVHGEQEPGNALVSDSLNLAFADPTGPNLDFLTLVDHNNNMSRKNIGTLQGQYPNKVVIPGTEMTTYNGHFNAQGNSPLVDFRLGEILKPTSDSDADVQTGDLTTVRGIEDPSSRFASIQAGGGFAQINHPKIFANAPSACRGCFWNYDDTRTDFSKVNAIEIQTGPAGLPAYGPSAMNAYTLDAISYYEHALASGAHIAAVGSSDDHDAKNQSELLPVPGDAFDATLGHGATMVHADQLSQAAIISAVKAGHTYVKPFGPDAPDVSLLAGEPGKAGYTNIPGDSVTGEAMTIQLDVKGAGASSPRPGPYTLAVLKNGQPISTVAVTGDDFSHNLQVTETGRYSFELSRQQGEAKMIEAYSTPVWFTKKDPVVVTPPPEEPSNKFSFAGVKLNKKKGTAALKVKVPGAGTVKLAGNNLAKTSAKPKKAGIVPVTVRATGKLKKALKKKGKATAKTKVTFTPTGGKAATKSKTVKLVLKKKKSKR